MKSKAAQSLPALAGNSLRTAIRESVQKFLDLDRYSLFIFGSEASGTADRRSDIDIGILGPDPVPGAVVQQIREDLETLRTLRPFDVVDFSLVDMLDERNKTSHRYREAMAKEEFDNLPKYSPHLQQLHQVVVTRIREISVTNVRPVRPC